MGRVIVEMLASEGARVVVHHHRSGDEAREVARQVDGHAVQADLSCPGGASSLVEQVQQLTRQGHLLGVCVNAAANFERSAFLASSDELWEQTLRLVVLSPATIVRELAPAMAEGGVVINVLDVAAHQPWKGYSHHCVAKAALAMLTQTLALELAPRLRVCGVSPGVVMLPEGCGAETAGRLRNRVPLRRLGDPDDVAQAVRYLVHADHVTGSVISVDGGMSLVRSRLPD